MTRIIREKLTLKERMDHIEKQNRRLKNYLFLFIVAVLAVAMMGAKSGPHDGLFRQIEAQKIPELDESLQKKIEMKKVFEREGGPLLNLVFHAGLIIFLVIILVVNSNTSQSLQKIDPDSQKSYFVQQKVKQGLDKIKAYFRPNTIPVEKRRTK